MERYHHHAKALILMLIAMMATLMIGQAYGLWLQ
jgi:hypothetical protein